jgi:DNA repair exonuclease SbcCD nuclease subunit
MKILHCSDIHLGRRPVGGVGEYSIKRYNDYFTAFERILETAIERGVDVVLIAGDLFDRKELVPEVLERTEILLRRCLEQGIQTVVIEGNHDNITPGNETDSWLIYLENKGFFRRPFCRFTDGEYAFVPVEIDGIRFFGAGYQGSMVNEALQSLAGQLTEEDAQRAIVIAHTAIASSEFLPGTVDREVIDLFHGKVLYMAGGHFHSYSVYPLKNPWFFIPGSPEYWELTEKGQLKGVIVFDTQTRMVEHIPLHPRRIHSARCVVETDSGEEFKRQFERCLENFSVQRGEDIIAIDIEMHSSLYIDIDWCEQAGAEAGALKTVVRIGYTSSSHPSTLDTAAAGIEETEREIIGSWEIFAPRKHEIVRALDRLKTYQREKNRDNFLETFDSVIEGMLGEGSGGDES